MVSKPEASRFEAAQDHAEYMQQQNDALLESQIANCLPVESQELLCGRGRSQCHLLGLQSPPNESSATTCRAGSIFWVPGPLTANYWSLAPSDQCRFAVDAGHPRAIRISPTGCGMNAAAPCHLLLFCSISAPSAEAPTPFTTSFTAVRPATSGSATTAARCCL